VRRLLAVLVGTAVFAGAGGGVSAQGPSVTTRSCAQLGGFFSVQLAGNKQGSYWLEAKSARFARVPAQRTVVAVWSFAPQAADGIAVYGWITDSQQRLSPSCRAAGAEPKRPVGGTLRARARTKDGWGFGQRYECQQRGRFLVEVQQLRRGKRMTVWMEETRELIAIAEVSGGSGWLRASKRCSERDI
jgi:hypothetical protein